MGSDRRTFFLGAASVIQSPLAPLLSLSYFPVPGAPFLTTLTLHFLGQSKEQ